MAKKVTQLSPEEKMSELAGMYKELLAFAQERTLWTVAVQPNQRRFWDAFQKFVEYGKTLDEPVAPTSPPEPEV